MLRSKLNLLSVIALGLFTSVAFAYVPPAEKILEWWFEAYEKAPSVTLQGSWQQGATTVGYSVDFTQGSGIAISEMGLPETDGTSKLVWTLLLRPRQILPTLKARGLDTAQTGLARHDGRIAFTVGAQGEGREGTQLWLDRETLHPLKLILQLEDGTGSVSFEGYDQSPSVLYPSIIKTTRNGSVRTYRIDRITKNSPAGEAKKPAR